MESVFITIKQLFMLLNCKNPVLSATKEPGIFRAFLIVRN